EGGRHQVARHTVAEAGAAAGEVGQHVRELDAPHHPAGAVEPELLVGPVHLGNEVDAGGDRLHHVPDAPGRRHLHQRNTGGRFSRKARTASWCSGVLYAFWSISTSRRWTAARSPSVALTDSSSLIMRSCVGGLAANSAATAMASSSTLSP